MEEKPKKRGRSRKAPVEAVSNGSDKTHDALPAKIQPAAPVSLLEPVSIDTTLDVTVPLPKIRAGGTNPLENGGMTVQGISALAPRRITCQQVEASYLSDVGQIRDNNEDNAGAFLGTIPSLDGSQQTLFGFLVLADGMGGHEQGEVASSIAVRKMTENVIKQFYLPSLEGRQPGYHGETPIEILQGLIEDTNQSILQEAHVNRVSMGTTLTCAVLVGQTAFVGHVGDSRMYVLEKSSGKLRQITHDHTMVQRLVDMGQLSPEDASNHPNRNILYMSLGQRGRVSADVEILPLADISHMLFCSDGLWEMVEDLQIEEILKNTHDPAEASAMLVAAANQAGGYDNVTVVVAKI
ncbi:MAG TPA: protein phosphatase 2C domain-containing protein [Chloroflexia bacterium]|nr:protein phosphatase 2C domain-containing protein [Chloroflexia bacterium]